MKLARPLLITLGIILVVAATGVAVALTPSVQRWAVRRMVAKQPDLHLEVGGVSAGFSHLRLAGVQMEKNGLKVKCGLLEADYSLWQLVFSHRLNIERLTANDLTVDASHLSGAKTGAVAAGAPVVAPGLLAQVELPVEVVLVDCRVEGRLLLPGPSAAGKAPVEVTFKISGGGIAPGKEGRLLLAATVKNPVADGKVGALHAQLSVRVTQTDHRTFSRLGLTAVVDAEGKSIAEQNQLKISAELTHDNAGENYAVSVDTVTKGVAENLLALNATLPAGQKTYAGQWTLKARTAQLEPFFLGAALPELNARGEGRFTFSPSAALSLQGNLDGEASRLEAIDPAWQAIGAVKLHAQFDAEETNGIARLRQLNIQIAGEQPVLELQATQAAEINFVERKLHVGGTAAGEALNLKLHGVPLAWVRPFVTGAEVSGGMITGEFSITGAPDRLSLRGVHPLRIDELTIVKQGEVLLSKGAVALAFEATLTAHELVAKISEFTLQTAAGDSLEASADVSIPVAANPPVTVTASYRGDLPTLLAAWLPLGRVKAAGEADLTLAGEKLTLRRINTTVTDAEGAILFKVAALRPFDFDLATRRATTGESGAVDLANLSIGRLTLDRLPLNQPGASLGGVVEQGEFLLTANAEKLTLHAVNPFKLTGVSLAQDHRPALTGLSIEALPLFEMSGSATAMAQTGEVTVRNAKGVSLATFKGEANQSAEAGLRANLTFNIDLPELASQPLFAGTQAVSHGRASGEIRAVVGASRQAEARMTVNGLVARDGGQTLPVANLSFRGIVQENGKISVQAPLLLDRAGQRSDLDFSLELTPAGRGFEINGKLSGEQIELEDALSVLGVFISSAAPADNATPAPAATLPEKATADTVSAWSHFSGQVALDIKSLTRGKEWSMTGLSGLVVIDPARLSLQKLEAAFGDTSRLAAKGDLRFAAGALPYQLDGDFSLTEFDVGKLFKAIDPAKPPTVEGLFTIAGHVAGNGETLNRTVDRAQGKFTLTSRQGIFRGLQRTTNKLSMTSKAVELGASVLGSILGSDKATKAAEKVAGTAYFVDQLAQNVGEFNYDQLSVGLVRDQTLNVMLEEISLISPEIRLLGKGKVTYVADKPLLDQPLAVTLSFSGRGKIEQLLGKLRLVDGPRDELGYARTKEPITISGTLAKPDPSAYFTKVATGKLSDFLDSGN